MKYKKNISIINRLTILVIVPWTLPADRGKVCLKELQIFAVNYHYYKFKFNVFLNFLSPWFLCYIGFAYLPPRYISLTCVVTWRIRNPRNKHVIVLTAIASCSFCQQIRLVSGPGTMGRKYAHEVSAKPPSRRLGPDIIDRARIFTYGLIRICDAHGQTSRRIL